MIGSAAALAAIDAAFAEPVTYTGAGLAGVTIGLIWADTAGQPFQGLGNTVRQISAEIRKSKLAGSPAKSDRLVRHGTTWRPIEIVDRDDVDAWVLTLEKVATS